MAKTYSFRMAFTTALEKGALETEELILKECRIVAANIRAAAKDS
jgi:hypothetical protein